MLLLAGSQYYGPGGGYSFFAGRDASRAFVTGQFEEADEWQLHIVQQHVVDDIAKPSKLAPPCLADDDSGWPQVVRRSVGGLAPPLQPEQ